MKPRLLFFCSDYQIGLTQAQTEQIIELNKEKDIDLVCISSEKEQEAGLHKKVELSGVKMMIVPQLDVHQNFKKLASNIDKIISDYDITHVNVQNNWQLALITYLKYRYFIPRKFKVIYTIHGYRHNSPLKAKLAILIIGMALLLFADRVISMSSYVSKRFWFVGYKTDIVFYIMNKPEYMKKVNHIKGNPIKMVFPAQFRYGKRQEILIEATKQYIEETGDRSIRLYLPGSGPLIGKMKKQVEESDLTENVLFPGQLMLSDVLSLYEECNIAVVSSNVETYGRCIVEPFVLGRCLLTQKTGVALDIVHDGRNGMFFTNSKSLAAILVKLHSNPQQIVEMGQQAFIDRAALSRDSVMRQYLSVIEKTK